MAASAEACGVMIAGGYGAGKRRSSSCSGGGFVLLPATTSHHHRRFPSISCKARGKNVSSQRRKQNVKLVLPRKLPLTAKNLPNGNEHAEAQNPSQNEGQTAVLDETSKSQQTEGQIVEQTHDVQTAVLDGAFRSHGRMLDNEDVVASAILISDAVNKPKTSRKVHPETANANDLIQLERVNLRKGSDNNACEDFQVETQKTEEDDQGQVHNINGINELDESKITKETQPKTAYSNNLVQVETANSNKAVVAEASDDFEDKTQKTYYDGNGQAGNVNGYNKLQICESKTIDFILTERDSDGTNISSIRLESLIEMIKNAEKNILLLNEARILALKNLDIIVAEKEEMQGQIHMLEAKLAHTEAQIKVVSQEKAHIQFLENELDKMKTEISSREIEEAKHLNGNRMPNSEVLTFDMISFHSLGAELDALRKENMLLKEDKQLLNEKLANVKECEKHLSSLERERSLLLSSVKDLESKLETAQEDVSRLYALKPEYEALWEKVENLQALLDNATKQADQAVEISEQNDELQRKIKKLETQLNEVNVERASSEQTQQYNELLLQKIKILEEHIQISDKEINSHIQLYEASVKEFQDTLQNLKEENKKRSFKEVADDMPWEFWSRLLLIIESCFLENKISVSEAKLLREMVWNKDVRIHDAYFSSKGKTDGEMVTAFMKLTSSRKSPALNIVHIAAEMAPVAKVGGLGDVVTGLSKALQKRGHLVEIILPKYDCIQSDLVSDLKMLNTTVPSYFDGQLYKNNIWVGTVEGLPVYFIEPTHPANFFSRGALYGQHDDFKRFSFFSRAALELLYQAGKRPDIIHCHDWHTAFIAPLYWEVYAAKGLDSARICFTCHNFEYQGVAPASELASSGLDVQYLHKPDRMQDNLSPDRINLLKGAVVFSNIVTTVSPTYAEEVRTAEGGRGLHETLKFHSKKFTGVLNGIDVEAWNPSTDPFLRFQYNADDLNGKAENKNILRKHLKLSAASSLQPLVGCITRLVPQKGVHLIRHAIYRTLELGGQFVLLGSSPVDHIQREFEGIANHFQNHPDTRLVLKYDDALSHLIYAAADMLVIPSIFEPCGLTQMIAMRYGSVPVVRRTGGLNDSVFDVDDDTIPVRFQNGFTFLSADEQGLGNAMERAFNFYMKNPQRWLQLVQKNMRIDFSWDTASAHYEELYEKAATKARAAARARV